VAAGTFTVAVVRTPSSGTAHDENSYSDNAGNNVKQESYDGNGNRIASQELTSWRYQATGFALVLIGIGIAAGTAFGIHAWLLHGVRVPAPMVTRYLAPPIEEILKAVWVVYLVRRHRVGFMVDAGIHGFAIGTDVLWGAAIICLIAAIVYPSTSAVDLHTQVGVGFSPAPGEAFVTIESPRGELGCFVASDGSPKPLRVHFRGPSYINLQALPKLIEGQLISDVIACIGTIDIVLGEVDR